jgi:hypothetical protein
MINKVLLNIRSIKTNIQYKVLPFIQKIFNGISTEKDMYTLTDHIAKFLIQVKSVSESINEVEYLFGYLRAMFNWDKNFDNTYESKDIDNCNIYIMYMNFLCDIYKAKNAIKEFL